MSKMESSLDNGEWSPSISVIHEPLTGWTWSAERGKGTFVRTPENSDEKFNLRIINSEEDDLEITVVVWRGVPYELDKVSQFCHEQENIHNQPFGSVALGGGLIASSLMHATLYPGKSATETAAMSLIVTEAGGVTTDLFGAPLTNYTKVVYGGKEDFHMPRGAIVASSESVAEKLSNIVFQHCSETDSRMAV